MARAIVILHLALLLVATHPPTSHAENASLSGDRTAQAARRQDAGVKGRTVEREKRAVLRTVEDLGQSRSVVQHEIEDLEKEIEAITILESPQRERDFVDLLDWYHDYQDWLGKETEDFETDLAVVSGRMSGEWKRRYDEMVMKQESLSNELEKRVKRYTAEEKRLAAVIERRKELQDRFGEMEERLKHLEERLGEPSRPAPERRDNERKTEKLRADIRVVQNELLSLPLVDEDLLKHYALLVERGSGEMEWLSLKREQYETQGRVAALIGRDPHLEAAAIEAELRKAERIYNNEIRRLSSRMDALDRKRSQVTPAGSLKEVERSRELRDFYESLKNRYDSEIRRLRVLNGAFEAEASEVLSDR